MDKKFVISSLVYGILGMVLGNMMAASHNHGQMVTHAHILLVGFVVSFIYGLCHKLWLDGINKTLASIQFYLHQLGALGMFAGLYLLYGGIVAPEKIDPLLASSSIAVLMARILMLVMFCKIPAPHSSSQ